MVLMVAQVAVAEVLAQVVVEEQEIPLLHLRHKEVMARDQRGQILMVRVVAVQVPLDLLAQQI